MGQGRFDGLHEAFDREEAAEMSSDRSFGFVVGGVLALIGTIGFVRESPHWIWWSSAAALLLAAALLAPDRLAPLNRLWTRLGCCSLRSPARSSSRCFFIFASPRLAC